jgi:hypothetical protein
MPRKATGELRPLADGFAARITIEGGATSGPSYRNAVPYGATVRNAPPIG